VFKEIRESMGLSPEEMAVKCRVSVATIHNWESGRSVPAGTAVQMLRYCAAYRASLKKLAQMSESSKKEKDFKDE
jgi:DNA-binding transcriptional regulator YiaG